MSEQADSAGQPIPAGSWERYAPYGRLIKMLLPSAGSIALYDGSNTLLWCSDGYERLDIRELIESLHQRGAGPATGLFTAKSGLSVYLWDLDSGSGRRLGSAAVELGAGRNGTTGVSLLASLLRPVVDCLSNQLALEQCTESAPAETSDGLELLLAMDEHERHEPGRLEQVVQHCAERLDAAVAVLSLPDHGISICAVAAPGQTDTQAVLDQTKRHLLAWAKLNGRALLVNGGNAANGANAANAAAPWKILSVPVTDDRERVAGVLALFRPREGTNFEIREQRILQVIARRVVAVIDSEHDALTGKLNRSAFERHAARVLARPLDGRESFLMHIDVDRLLTINEAFGMQAGDEVLQRVAGVIGARIARSDLLCRLGADQFAVLHSARDRDSAEALAKEIARAVMQLGYLHEGEAVPVTISIGLIAVDASGTVPHALAAAEFACKRAKLGGGNRVECRSSMDSGTSLVRRREFAASQLSRALADGRFELVRQPITSIVPRADGLLGHEILLRMRDGDGELIAASRFLEAAVDCRLMPALDRWVIATTMAAVGDGRIELAEPGQRLMLNVSAQSLTGGDLPRFLLDAINHAGLAPGQVCVELRESTVLHDVERTERLMRPLAEAGVAIALEGFGSGLGALLQLKQLPVSFVKLDGDLVRRIADDPYARSIVLGTAKAVVSLGVTPIAEHVESERIAAALVELEVEYGQGFYLGRPRALCAGPLATGATRNARVPAFASL
jgi:diguanylate cyclase (GGDEF)-like protein